MKDWLIIQILQSPREILIPIFVSIICFFVEHKVTKRAERKREVPKLYILKLNGKEKTRLNEAKIKRCKYIIEMYYQEYSNLDYVEIVDRAIHFKKIDYNTLLDRVKMNSMVLIGFEKIDIPGLSLKHLMTIRGSLYEMDDKVVPVLIDEDTSYCLVCREEDAPSSLKGLFLGKPIRYDIKGRDCVISPRIKK